MSGSQESGASFLLHGRPPPYPLRSTLSCKRGAAAYSISKIEHPPVSSFPVAYRGMLYFLVLYAELPLRVCCDGLFYGLACLVGAHENVARLAALARADDAEFRHRVDEARRARVADAEPALDAA